MRTFYEFFAGGGMARLGLEPSWTCLFANDICPKKAAAYRANFGDRELRVDDIRDLSAADLPGRADLMWGSFPCQDLSLAGVGAGLNGSRSGTFHALWALVGDLADSGRAPKLVVLENVCGALTSHGGRDFAAIATAFEAGGYWLGPLIIDASWFAPQSRQRLFLVGVRKDLPIERRLMIGVPDPRFHSPSLVRAVQAAGGEVCWWKLPTPPARNISISDVVEDGGWAPADDTQRLLAQMTETHQAKVAAAQATSLNGGGRQVGAVFRRTRMHIRGGRAPRTEVRFDGLAGCLRTPAGGSSRQMVVVVETGQVRSRLLTPRETARLMGLPEDYVLPANRTEAYHLTGDGVSVDAVRWLAANLLEPILT